MQKDLKKAAKDSVIYSLSNIATKVIGFILLPIYTNKDFLSEKDYGVLTDVEIITQLLITILGICLYQSLIRWYWDTDMIRKQKSIVFTILTTIILFSAFAYIPYFFFSERIALFLLHSINYKYLISLIFWAAFSQAISIVPFSLLKLQSRPVIYSLANIIKLILTLFLTIYFIIYKDRGVEGIFEAQLIGNIAILIFLLPYLIKNICFYFDFKELKRLLIYSYPLIFASISGVLLSVFDRIGITKINGFEEAAIYGFGFKIANTIKLVVVTSIQMAITPMIFQKMNDPNAKEFYQRILSVVAFIVIFSTLSLSLFSAEIIKIFAHNEKFFIQAIYIIPIIGYALFFGALKDITVLGLHISKKTKIVGVLIIIIALLNFILNYIFIPLWGKYGASFSTLLSQIIFFLLILFYSQKYYYVPYKFSKITLISVVSIIVIIAGLYINISNIILSIFTKSILLLIFFIFIYKFVLSKEEQRNLWKLIRKNS